MMLPSRAWLALLLLGAACSSNQSAAKVVPVDAPPVASAPIPEPKPSASAAASAAPPDAGKPAPAPLAGKDFIEEARVLFRVAACGGDSPIPARFDAKAEPLELPTVPSDLEELQKQVQSILQKLDKIPFDTLGEDAHHVMVSLDASLKNIDTLTKRTDNDVLPEIRDSLRELQKTMQATQATLAEDSPMQQDTRQALRGVAEATRSLKALTDSLDRHPESLVRGKKEDGR